MYSTIVNLSFNTAQVFLYPNPVTDNLTLSMYNTGNGSYRVTLTNNIGKVVLINNYTVSGNQQIIHISTGSYAAGIYFVNVTDASGKNILREKIIKQ